MRKFIGLTGVVAITVALAAINSWAGERISARQAAELLQVQFPQARTYEHDGRITRVYGQPLAFGASPQDSAEQFRVDHAQVFGVEPADLVPTGLAEGADPVQPLMYERDTGTYKFFLIRYAQQDSGIPVFRADLRLLVRNEADFPLVLAASNLRDLGDFSIPAGAAARVPGNIGHAQAVQAALETPASDHSQERADVPGPTDFSPSEYVIWAGVDRTVKEPRLAVTFIGDNGLEGTSEHGKWLFVADASTGTIYYVENLIIFEDVTGNVSGMATQGAKADFCNPEAQTPMPWAQVGISGGNTAYTDANGAFVILNGGTSPVTVSSYMSGIYFFVDDVTGAEETLSQSVTPPGPANFVHNEANSSEFVRAQVNGYVQANVVRDFCLTYNPSYPTISGQTNFPVRVNRSDGYCPGNAWYDYSAINFCRAAGGYPNTAWSQIIHHEYGHHIVSTGGSGQGQYGEGMADCISVLLCDCSVMGYGFLGNCNSGIRDADNNIQYPCSDEIHYCGQLISGCIWSTRNELIITHPADYLDILSNLTINSVLLHSGTDITPQITIDFLTLDDDDGNIGNGTPHRTEICAGFGAHNMDCPPLETGLSVSPSGEFLSEGPSGGPFTPPSMDYTLENLGSYAIDYTVTKSAAWITLTNATGTIPAYGTAVVTVSINSNADGLPDGSYDDTLYFTNTTDHVGDTTRDVTLGVGVPSVVYQWTFDTDPGWSTEGLWAFGQPTGGGGEYGYPDPTSGYTGNNVYGYNLDGDYENYLPERHLTTTAIDCSALSQVSVRFRRWLGVEQPLYDHAYVRVSNNGSNWTTVWQNTAEITDSAWTLQQYDLSSVADGQPTVYVRWTMGTTDGGWRYCGWNIDDVQIVALGAQEQHTLTVNTTGQGSVTLDPAGGTYPADTTVTLTASADPGWAFDHWEGDLSGSANPETILMDADKTVTAVFVQQEYTLTVNTTGQGTVTLNPPGGLYTPGTTVTLTASAGAGWAFDHWEGDLSGSTNPTTILMDADKTVTAVFVQEQYTLTVSTTGSGSVDLSPPGGTYPSFTTVTLTANADAGWAFDHWEGDLTGSANPTTIVMDADKTVTAVFVQPQYALTVNTVGQGTVTLDPPGGVYDSGTIVTLTASPATDWVFDRWEGDLSGSDNPTTIVMDADKTVTAVFTYTLAVDDVADGEIPVAGTVSGTYVDTWADAGAFQTITERESGGKPQKRYSFLEHKWTFNVTGGATVTFFLNGWHGASNDGDDFVFAYSTDDANYVDMFTLLSIADDGTYQSFNLPNSTHGLVYVRVTDTDRTPGHRDLDSVFIDHMFIRSEVASGNPPAAPSGLTAAPVSAYEISLAWMDNSGDEYGFEIERSPDGTNGWTLIDTVGAGVTSYADVGLTPSTTYYYQVRAFNGAGPSEYSNTASAETMEGAAFVLEGVGSTQGKKQVVDLTWSGASSVNVDIYRGTVLIATVPNDGYYRDVLGKDITGTFVYQVCEADTDVCSNEVTIGF